MSNYKQRRAELLSTIHNVLYEHPELAGEASAAIHTALIVAVGNLRKQKADAQTAMAMSLALLPPNRLTKAARKALESTVLRALPDKAYQTKAERQFSEAKDTDPCD
jgi:hypothetical protein